MPFTGCNDVLNCRPITRLQTIDSDTVYTWPIDDDCQLIRDIHLVILLSRDKIARPIQLNLEGEMNHS